MDPPIPRHLVEACERILDEQPITDEAMAALFRNMRRFHDRAKTWGCWYLAACGVHDIYHAAATHPYSRPCSMKEAA